MKRIMLTVLTASVLQIMISNVPAKDDEDNWKLKISAGVNSTSGNSDTTLINTGLSAERKGTTHEFSAGMTTAYGKNNDDVTEKNGEASAQYNFLFSKKTYLYATTLASCDEIARLDYRITAGPGIGYYLIREPNHKLSFEVGSSFMIEQFSEADDKATDTDDDKITLRATQRYEAQISQTAVFSEAIEYLPNTDNYEDYLMNMEFSLETAVSKEFSLRVTALRKYDSEPVEDVKKEDVTIRASLVYQLD